MEEALRLKQIECETIQKSFDDYVESSKELESELEIALEEAESKATELGNAKSAAEEKAKDLQNKLNAANKDLSKCQSELIALRDIEAALQQSQKALENLNEELSSKVRILEATEEDLRHQLQTVEEDVVFLQTDLHEMDAAKADLEERLKQELAAVKSELEVYTSTTTTRDSPVVADTQRLQMELDSTIHTLQLELEDANARLAESHAQNDELLEELTKVTDEVVALQQNAQQRDAHDTALTQLQDENAKLQHEVGFLKEQVVTKHAAISDLLGGAECEELRELAAQNDEKEAEIAELRAQIASYIEVSNVEKMELVAEMSEKIHQMSAELSLAKAASVSQAIAAGHGLVKQTSTFVKPESLGGGNSGSGIASGIASGISLSNPLTFTQSVSGKGLVAQATALIAANDLPAIHAELLRLAGDCESIRKSNAKLLNKLQQLQGNIQVCCRSRPPSEAELSAGKICVDVADDTELMCYDGRMEAWKTFAFDRVWRPEASQADVFTDVEPMITSVVDGYNVCIMAYGQTGSGKTFTMDGYGDQYGVSYRTIQKLFDLLAFRKLQTPGSASVTDSGPSTNSSVVPRGGKDTHKGKVPPTKPSNYKRLPPTLSSSNFEFSNPLSGGGSQASGMGSTNSSVDGINRLTSRESNPSPPVPLIVGEDGPDSYLGIGFEGSHGVSERSASFDDSDSVVSDSGGGEAQGFSFSVELSMMEIYNEQVYDLLSPSSGGGQADGVSLDVRQGPDNVVSVPGLKSVAVSSIEDVMAVFSRGTVNRATSSTNLNEHSSRSHLIILVEVSTRTGSESAVKGKLHLVDLAGSERVGKSGVTGAAMKEAQYINKSLSALGDVMEALDQKSKHIPYRNSKLTYLLQNSLGGNSRTMMIVTVCPTDLTFDETLFTLQFATRVRNITIGPAQKNSNAKNLELSVKTLKAELKEAKRKRQLLEDAAAEAKRELKKASDRVAVPETKLKALEEAKKAAEAVVAQSSKQQTELHEALAKERESKEQLHNDWEMVNRNLKKATEANKEVTKELDKTQHLVRSRDREIEALKAQVQQLETDKHAARTAVPHPIVTDTHHRTSNGTSHGTPVSSVTRTSSSSTEKHHHQQQLHSRLESAADRSHDLALSPMLKANSAFHDFPDVGDVHHKKITASTSTAAASTSTSSRLTAMGPPLANTVLKSSALDGGASRVRNNSLSALPSRRVSNLGAPVAPRAGLGVLSESSHTQSHGSLLFSAEKATPTPTAPSATAASHMKTPALSARSEEALKRHQARMEKKREAQVAENKRNLLV